MDFRTTVTHKVTKRLWNKQYDVILTREQSVLMEIKSLFEGGNMKTENIMLGYRIDLYYLTFNLQWKFMKVDIAREILTMK